MFVEIFAKHKQKNEVRETLLFYFCYE